MSTTAEPVQVDVTLRGNVGEFAGGYARRKVAEALTVAPGPVLGAHVVLNWRHDPAVERHATAEVTAHVDAHIVRARSAAPTMSEAVDSVEYRLRRQLVQLRDRAQRRHRWTGFATVREWRHGDVPRRPIPWFPRSEESRELVRHKSFASAPMTVDEAAFEMDLLDHDFFLFRDVASGGPALGPTTRHGSVWRRTGSRSCSTSTRPAAGACSTTGTTATTGSSSWRGDLSRPGSPALPCRGTAAARDVTA